MKYNLRLLKRLSMLTMACIFAFAFTIGGYVVNAAPPSQNAFYCGFVQLGRNGCHGYVTNADFYVYDSSAPYAARNNVIIYNVSNLNADALPANLNVTSFESLYETYLARGSASNYDYDSFGAAATIDSMLGVSGPALCQWYASNPTTTTCTWSAAVAYAQDPTHLSDWVARVNYYASKGWINWNQSIFKPLGYPDSGHACYPTAPTLCWQGRVTDPPVLPSTDARDILWKGVDEDDYGLSDAVVFHNPDGSQFSLDHFCGNMLGQLEALAPPSPPATVSCAGFTASVAMPDPNRPFALQASVQYTPASAAPLEFGPDAMAVTLNGPSPYRTISQTTKNPSISNGTATATLNVPATSVSGTFTLTWQVTGSQVPTTSCSAPIVIAYQPYFDVVGGDVSAGQGFGTSCTDNSAADIKGYNLDTGGASPNYFGAGTRQMALATGSITGFASDLTNNITSGLGGSSDGIAVHLPSALAGSNAAPGASAYGGNFLGSYTGSWCVPDYAGSVTGTADYTSQPYWNSLTANSTGYIVRLTGDQTFNGIQLRPGVRVTVIVTGGNVYLGGNITYDNYTRLQDIPQFSLLVSNGDIFINPSVSELHGLYDAQSNGSSNGQIFTCADGNGLSHVLKDYARCSVQALIIYGAVAANQVILGRTTGSIAKSNAVSGVPAERIVYTPELWLSGPSVAQTSCSEDPTQIHCMYQSYSSLPPVL